MKIRLRNCLVILLITAITFCLSDTNLTNNTFFAKFIISNSYAKDYNEAEVVAKAAENYDIVVEKMVEIAKKIANDEYTTKVGGSKTTNKYTYLWIKEDDPPFTAYDGIVRKGHGAVVETTSIYYNDELYATLDCAEFVGAVITFMSRELDEIEDTYLTTYVNGLKIHLPPLGFGCHKLYDTSELKDGDILQNASHTEIFFWEEDKTPKQVGAHDNPKELGGASDHTIESSISECNYSGDDYWECYWRYGTESSYTPTGRIGSIIGDVLRWLSDLLASDIDPVAELDEQIFDFQGNPQIMVFEGETEHGFWLFELLSAVIDFINGFLVSLFINPIMAVLNAIVNFLVNFINHISGTATET